MKGVCRFFLAFYRRLISIYASSSVPLFRYSVEFFLTVIVAVLQFIQGIRFPARVLGSRFWILRWRLEFLMEWNEKESVYWCRKLIKPGMVVVDVGAHIGYYTRIFSGLVGEAGRVLAFEPHPENYPILESNIKSSRYKNVNIYNMCISNKDAPGILYTSPGHSNHSLIYGYTESLGTNEVDCLRMDTFLNEHTEIKQIDFVKIDVEGAELLVLEGMSETISSNPELIILIEYNPKALRCYGIEPFELVSKLDRLGFDVKMILPGAKLSPVIAETSETVNLLCLKNSYNIHLRG